MHNGTCKGFLIEIRVVLPSFLIQDGISKRMNASLFQHFFSYLSPYKYQDLKKKKRRLSTENIRLDEVTAEASKKKRKSKLKVEESLIPFLPLKYIWHTISEKTKPVQRKKTVLSNSKRLASNTPIYNTAEISFEDKRDSFEHHPNQHFSSQVTKVGELSSSNPQLLSDTTYSFTASRYMESEHLLDEYSRSLQYPFSSLLDQMRTEAEKQSESYRTWTRQFSTQRKQSSSVGETISPNAFSIPLENWKETSRITSDTWLPTAVVADYEHEKKLSESRERLSRQRIEWERSLFSKEKANDLYETPEKEKVKDKYPSSLMVSIEMALFSLL